MKSIFVSYTRSDAHVVGRLVGQLKEAGYQVWHDMSLTGGQHWWDTILAEIRRCDVFIFALSRESIDSEACRRELSYAAALHRRLMPVRVNANISPQNLARPLAEIQVIEFLNPESDLLRLVRAINLAAPACVPPNPLPAPPPLPVSYLGGLNERLHAGGELSAAEQKSLCTDLRIAVDEGHSAAEIRGAVERFLQRPELLASVKNQLDCLLVSLRPTANRERQASVDSGKESSHQEASGRGNVTTAPRVMRGRGKPWTPLRALSALCVVGTVPLACGGLLGIIGGEAGAVFGMVIGVILAAVVLEVPAAVTNEQRKFRRQWLWAGVLASLLCMVVGMALSDTPGNPVPAQLVGAGMVGLAMQTSIGLYRWCS